MYAKTAKNMWEILKQRYSQVNAPHVHQLRREISLLQQGNLSVTDYFNKLQELWDELPTTLFPNAVAGLLMIREERHNTIIASLEAKPFEAAAFHAGGSCYVNKPSCSHYSKLGHDKLLVGRLLDTQLIIKGGDPVEATEADMDRLCDLPWQIQLS
ncbi:hypothetical protein GH714_033026 [Hevea brasiliensis]|uniref:Retrotransposon gag domain-containing protein n=1 Tax=Hevea brasiliensis TaxID=3981 RepID=A0A6A6NBQ5_HEVBR|nr:hypothetical protein GH714_033026 [Hevea brasiliensis]